jgi:hypothetical protein
MFGFDFRQGHRVGPTPSLSLKPGARLVREWRGRTHTVTVTEDGFEYAGTRSPSLTTIAETITIKLKSYAAARREMKLHVEHRQHKGLNNRAENSHQPTRPRERIMKRFKSRRQAQSFLFTHDQVANLFHIPYSDYTTAMPGAPCASEPLAMWSDISKANLAA